MCQNFNKKHQHGYLCRYSVQQVEDMQAVWLTQSLCQFVDTCMKLERKFLVQCLLYSREDQPNKTKCFKYKVIKYKRKYIKTLFYQ